MQRPDPDERRHRAAREPLAARRDRPRSRPSLTRHGLQQGHDEPDRARACSGRAGIATADTSLADAGYAVMLARRPRHRREPGHVGLVGRAHAGRLPRGARLDPGAAVVERLASARPAARTWASRRCSSPRPTPRACSAGKPRAVKAVWADVPMADAYRDVTFHGGAIDAGFIPLWLGLINALSATCRRRRRSSDPARPAPTWLEHLAATAATSPRRRSPTATLGEDAAYDGAVLPAALARRARRASSRSRSRGPAAGATSSSAASRCSTSS